MQVDEDASMSEKSKFNIKILVIGIKLSYDFYEFFTDNHLFISIVRNFMFKRKVTKDTMDRRTILKSCNIANIIRFFKPVNN